MLSTVSHGPSRYPIVRTSWYRLRNPYVSLPANLESVAESWKRLAPSVWVPIASEFFFKTWRNAYYLHVNDLGHIGKLEAILDSFKTPLTNICDDYTYILPGIPLDIIKNPKHNYMNLNSNEVLHTGFGFRGKNERAN